MNKDVITAAVFAAIAVTSAAAAEVNPWYLSGVVGRSDFKINNADFSPLTVTSIDKKDTQFGIAAGYRRAACRSVTRKRNPRRCLGSALGTHFQTTSPGPWNTRS